MQTSRPGGVDNTLTSRYECKYFVSEERADQIRREIQPFLTLDPFSAQAEDHRYPVYSLYFDSPGLRLYQDTVEGARNRFKLRLRYYDAEATGPVFAEVKKRNDQIVRKALAIGANDAIRINAEPTSSWFVAHQIANVAKQENYDIVFLGKETIDYNGSVVGGMLAELMNASFVSLATSLEVEGGVVKATREAGGGLESVEASLPAVVSAAKGMAEQRIPNMRGIMAARTKPLQVVEPGQSTQGSAVAKFSLPPAKGDCVMVSADQPEELVRLLREEAKVL